MQFNLRILVNWTGTAIAAMAVIYVLYLFSQYSNEIDFSSFSPNQWLMFLLFALIYASINIFLAFSWQSILAYLSTPIKLRKAIRIFGISQLAKYLPGNILHLAGRQAMGMVEGIPALSLIKSAVWELVLIVVVGSLFSILIMPIFFPVLVGYSAIIFFTLAILFVGWGLFRFFDKKILHAYFAYLIFLSISGVIFASLLAIISNGYEAHYHLAMASFVIALIAGLITPGTPAGIGIRELVLIFLLKGFIAEADILIAVIIGRLVTISGDFIFYISALFTDKAMAINDN